MKWNSLAASALLAGVLTGCGGAELSVEEACGEINEPMLNPVDDVDAGHRATIALLREVGDRGDDEVRSVFGEAADAIEYVYEHGGVADGIEPEVPDWVDAARDQLVSTCGLAFGG